MFNKLPDEIIRKIISNLDCKKFITFNIITKDIHSLNQNLLLIPYFIEGVYSPDEKICSEKRVKFHKKFYGKIAKKEKTLGLLKDYIETINILNGDYVYINDSIDRYLVNYYYKKYWVKNPTKTTHNFVKLNKFKLKYKYKIINSLNLRALLY